MSSATLARKLCIKPGMTFLVDRAPENIGSLLTDLPEGCRLAQQGEHPVHGALVFVRSRAEVMEVGPAMLGMVREGGLVWFAYPKKSGGVPSDLSREVGWEPVYRAGYESVAQISIDETWTGYRFRPKHLVGSRSRPAPATA